MVSPTVTVSQLAEVLEPLIGVEIKDLHQVSIHDGYITYVTSPVGRGLARSVGIINVIPDPEKAQDTLTEDE